MDFLPRTTCIAAGSRTASTAGACHRRTCGAADVVFARGAEGLPAETRITLHACEEGWSYIAEWTGVRLSHVLELAGTVPEARYVVFTPFENAEQRRVARVVEQHRHGGGASSADAARLWHERRRAARPVMARRSGSASRASSATRTPSIFIASPSSTTWKLRTIRHAAAPGTAAFEAKQIRQDKRRPSCAKGSQAR